VSVAAGYPPALRIFSYLPNPRLAKASIAARLCGVALEVRGAAPRELAGWLWDFDARPLGAGEAGAGTARPAHAGFSGTLHKTEAFLAAQPFGNVPAAFSPNGTVGIFESNSIARAVVRLAPHGTGLYGNDAYGASRIDGFLDASLIFAREVQVYLLELAARQPEGHTYERARAACASYLSGIERALAPAGRFLVGAELTLADICFATELALFSAERAQREVLAQAGLQPLYTDALRQSFSGAFGHFDRLCQEPAFACELGPYLEKLDA